MKNIFILFITLLSFPISSVLADLHYNEHACQLSSYRKSQSCIWKDFNSCRPHVHNDLPTSSYEWFCEQEYVIITEKGDDLFSKIIDFGQVKSISHHGNAITIHPYSVTDQSVDASKTKVYSVKNAFAASFSKASHLKQAFIKNSSGSELKSLNFISFIKGSFVDREYYKRIKLDDGITYVDLDFYKFYPTRSNYLYVLVQTDSETNSNLGGFKIMKYNDIELF